MNILYIMFKKIQQSLKIVKDGEKNIIESLYADVKKDKGKQMPVYKKGGAEPKQVYTADLLSMPNDGGYNYLLVVVDTITGETDASPLKTKDAESVLQGFKDIFAKGTPLTMPKWSMLLDPGPEFKNAIIHKYFSSNGVLVRYGKVDRSRQQALAEHRNKVIAKGLFQKQVGQELVTGEPSTAWVGDVQQVLDAINEYEKEKYKLEKQRENKRLKKGMALPNLQPKVPILVVGTKVRVKLDKPKGVLGEKLHGTFRATDIKWNPEIRTIRNIILTPNQPVMYQVEGETTGFTRNQLQVVESTEKPVPKELLKDYQKSVETAQAAIPQIIKKVSQKMKQQVAQVKPQAQPQQPQAQAAPPQQTRLGRMVKPKKIFDL